MMARLKPRTRARMFQVLSPENHSRPPISSLIRSEHARDAHCRLTVNRLLMSLYARCS